jgi:glycosyltransferase involved in cell wall biosynthesis
VKLLYVSWDGPTDTYLETLFFPIFSKLRDHGVSTHVLQFSWNLSELHRRQSRLAHELGVGFEVHAVPRRPLRAATALALGAGAVRLALVARQLQPDVVMPRAYLPGAMTLLGRAGLAGARLVWDADGLTPDERVDFAGWSRTGSTYRAFMAVERRLLHTSDGLVTRTAAARQVLLDRSGGHSAPIAVVANGKDPHAFRPGTQLERQQVRGALGLTADAPLLIYVGSIGPQYRAREMARCFALIRRRVPNAHFLVLTGAEQAIAAALDAEGVPKSHATIRSVAPAEVSAMMRAADAGFSFRTPTESMRGVCPIKVAEYLLSGVPVLGNAGVGDLDAQFANSGAGVFARDFSDAALADLANGFVDHLLANSEAARANARKLGVTEFSLDRCAAGYHAAIAAARELPARA